MPAEAVLIEAKFSTKDDVFILIFTSSPSNHQDEKNLLSDWYKLYQFQPIGFT